MSLWNFALMAAAMSATLPFLPSQSDPGQLGGFFAAFLVLFVATGIGNGSVFRMIPSVFLSLHRQGVRSRDEAAQESVTREGETESAVALGFTASLAAFGGFYIPLVIGIAISITGQPAAAAIAFGLFYVSCVLATWWWYFRKDAEVRC